MKDLNWPRIGLATIAAHLTSLGALGLLFGNPLVERILFTDEAGQSSKVLSVFFEQEPLPTVTPLWGDVFEFSSRRLAVQGLLLLWSLSLVLLFAAVWAPRPGRRWLKGLGFGVAAWAILFLFFEAWVPYNMLGEPIRLVGLELALQLVAMVLTGIVIALVYPSVTSPSPEP